MNPPIALKKNKQLSVHGYTRQDPYYWLNDRENPEVIEYLNAENAYTKEGLAHIEPLKNEIFEEIKKRIKQKDSSVPFKWREHYYQTKYEEGKEYPIYVRASDEEMTDSVVILDANENARNHAYYQIGGYEVSPDNKYLAYSEDTVSRRIYKICFKDLLTGEKLSWHIQNSSGSLFWSNDSKFVFYVEIDSTTLRPFHVKRWSIDDPLQEPVSVFEETDEMYYVGIKPSISGNYLFIESDSTLTSEVQVIDLNHPALPSVTFLIRKTGHEYNLEHEGHFFYIKTNTDGRNFCLKRTKEINQDMDLWETIIPHSEERLLEDYAVIAGKIIFQDRYNANSFIKIIDDSSCLIIPFDEEVYVAGIGTNADPDSDFVRVVYTSLSTPSSIYDFHFANKKLVLRKQEEIIGGYDPKEYHTERIWVPARDGVKVPVSMVYKKSLYAKNESPLLLYGYGSYGHSIDPAFGLARLSLLNRGIVFAIAHIRGGEEMGRKWYEDGRQLKKLNTFYDFIDCGEYLINNSFCHPKKLFAMGGSAGGLLMGAVMNMAPDLWAGIVAAVPFVDVLTTMLDDSIPLTTGEYDEWGNPNIKKYYDYMALYSPYDNIVKKNFPPLLVTTGLHDSQVQYWEPAKWVAKLRANKTDDHPLFLRTNMEAGHGGASGRFKRYEEIAFEYAFLIDLAK